MYKSLNTFRAVSMLEGISFLFLLFIAMPVKYYLGYPFAVTVAGWMHGLLFATYIYLAMSAAQRCGWSDRFQFLVMLASMLPFACFFLEKKLRREALAVAYGSS